MRVGKPKTNIIKFVDMNVDASYQRMPNKPLIRMIAKDFDSEAMGSLLLGQRKDGTYWIVDGQQRKLAAEQAGYTNWPCNIFQSEGAAHEAKVFREINANRRRPSAAAQFKALVREGNPNACEISKTVQNAGYTIDDTGKGGKAWSCIACAGALQKVHKLGGSGLLKEVLRITTEAWRGEKEALHGDPILGLATLLTKCPDIDRRRLVNRLAAKHPVELLRYADSSRQLTGGSRAEGIAGAYLNFYNKGLHNKLSLNGSSNST